MSTKGGIKCPECGAWTITLETRMRSDNSRRRTIECGNLHKFTTVERVEKVEHGGDRYTPKRKLTEEERGVAR